MNIDLILSELTFKAVKSSGAGGQHVNKVSSKVVLSFNILESKFLSDNQKELLIKKFETKLTKNYLLVLKSDESRSQHKNKGLVINRFFALIQEGLIVPKKRRPTRTPKRVKEKRLEEKQKKSIKKTSRKSPNLEL